MTRKTTVSAVLAILAVLAATLMLACGADSEQLTRQEVAEIARAEAAGAAPPQEPGISAEEVERMIQAALADVPAQESEITEDDVREIVASSIAALPEPEPGITQEEVRKISRNAVASIPLKSAPAQYTKFFVENAIGRYESEGLDATLAHYNRLDSIDGQWYVFIIDANDKVIAHYDSHLIGEDLKGPVGTDANGYNFGPAMLEATEDGKWVSYVFRNPEQQASGPDLSQLELKNVWVVRNDDLLFASGWYIDADAFTRQLVSAAVEEFHQGGLLGTMQYFARPDNVLAGLEAAIDYYNNAESPDGKWFAFVADPTGQIAAHSDMGQIGTSLDDIFGGQEINVSEDGSWLSTDAFRVWMVGHDGWVFGSGWFRGDVN